MAGRTELKWAHNQSEEGLEPGFNKYVSAWSYQEAPHLIYLNPPDTHKHTPEQKAR